MVKSRAGDVGIPLLAESSFSLAIGKGSGDFDPKITFILQFLSKVSFAEVCPSLSFSGIDSKECIDATECRDLPAVGETLLGVNLLPDSAFTSQGKLLFGGGGGELTLGFTVGKGVGVLVTNGGGCVTVVSGIAEGGVAPEVAAL